MVNKYVGITNYNDFKHNIEGNIKDIGSINIIIKNKKAIVLNGKLADKIVTRQAAGQSVGVINAIADFILSVFSKDYRDAKTQASDLFGRFEKRHYANTEEGRAVYYVYKKVLTEKLKQMFGKDNSVNTEDMARLKKETWTLANNNPTLAKEIYAEDRANANRSATAKANSSATANYMAQRSNSPDKESIIAARSERKSAKKEAKQERVAKAKESAMMREWHSEADKRRADYLKQKAEFGYYRTPEQMASEKRTETLLNKPSSTDNVDVVIAAQNAAAEAVKTKNASPVKNFFGLNKKDVLKADLANTVALIEIQKLQLERAEEQKIALGKDGDTMNEIIAQHQDMISQAEGKKVEIEKELATIA